MTTPAITKQQGVTQAERYLTKLCESSFLSLWSYPGIYRDQGNKKGGVGKEVCDLLVAFGNDIIIFSDKDCGFPESGNLVQDWSRWFRRTVQRSAAQVWGAERWIRTFPDRLFLDRTCSRHFPVELPDLNCARLHRVVVAHDAARRCRQVLGGSGSLVLFPAITGEAHWKGPIPIADIKSHRMQGLQDLLGDPPYEGKAMPFHIGDIDPTRGFVHVFDDASLEVVMRTLDTTADFVDYLTKKEAFLRSGKVLFVPGEDDLLAYYLQAYNGRRKHDFVFPSEPEGLISLVEGEWRELVQSQEWADRDKANQVSYVWDRLIEKFSGHILDGTSIAYPEASFDRQELAVRVLARENRSIRRVLGSALADFLSRANVGWLAARVVAPLESESPYYIFLTVTRVEGRTYNQYRLARRNIMHSYSLALKLKYPDAKEVVVFATEPNGSIGSSADLIYCDVSELTPEQEREAKRVQTDYGFFNQNGPTSPRKDLRVSSATFRKRPTRGK